MRSLIKNLITKFNKLPIVIGFIKSPLIGDVIVLGAGIFLYIVTQDIITAWLVSLYALAIAWKHWSILFPKD